MASDSLFEFMYDGKRVFVFTGGSSSDVFYSLAGGRTISSGLRYNSEKGWFNSRAGNILKHEEAKTHIRKLLSD